MGVGLPPLPSPLWQVLHEWEPATGEPLQAQFQRDEALLALAARGQLPPTLRLWRHRRAFVLGHRDTRLPAWQGAAAALAAAGWATAVRPSGGVGVPLDAGVLNLSLVYADDGLDVDGGFALMHALLRGACAAAGLDTRTGRVAGSYCPGASDVSVAGRKVAGVCQRRKRGATAVQAFLLVEGTGVARGCLARDFYRAAAGPDPVPGGSLAVQPAALASLAELAPGLTVAAAVAAAMRSLRGA